MKKRLVRVKEIGITAWILFMFFGICLLVQQFLNIHPLIPMFFTLAVFLVSKYTAGYFLGIFASLVSVLAVNYAFTFPHFRFNFTISENLISAIVMLIVTIMTSTMTTQIKRHEQKNEDGRLNLQIVDTSVEELLDVVLEKFKRRYPDQVVFLSMPDEFVSIQVDPILIEQVILNILENAMQHAEGMETIRIAVCKYEGGVSFSIADDGCGIPENIRQKLFREIIEKKGDMVVKDGDNPANGKRKPIDGERYNMGIGMYVCAAIIKAHQGEFFVKNLLPKGCSFQFLLKTEVKHVK